MKNILLVATAIIMTTQTSTAQITLRPELGLNLSNMKRIWTGQDRWPAAKAKAGLKGGAYVNIPLVKGLYIEPGLLYVAQGYSMDIIFSDINGNTSPGKLKCNTHYLQIPLNLGYELLQSKKTGKLFIHAGPYLGYAVAGKEYVTENTFDIPDRKLAIGNRKEDDLLPLDWGINIGLGYQIPKGIYIRLQYSAGIANLTPQQTTVSARNYAASLAFGYDLPIKKEKIRNPQS